MDVLKQVQKLRALEQEAAQQLATRRHVHISERPLVIVAYHLSGDLGAPVGFMLGTTLADPLVVAVGEPRNRDQRFGGLMLLAGHVREYLANFEDTELLVRTTRSGTREIAVANDAPQLVFPNGPTAAWCCGLLGRALRYLQTTGERPVDPSIPELGRDLSFFSDRSSTLGQSVVFVAAEQAVLHWATGQTPIEDQNIHTVTAWIAAKLSTATRSLDSALSEAEARPPAGPVPDPAWDADVLAPLVARFNADVRMGVSPERASSPLREALAEALEPAWNATWQLRDHIRALPEAAHVAPRWQEDREAWAYHLERIRTDRAWFRRIPDPLQAARLLERSEASIERVGREMALDDPLVAARAVANGEALSGTISAVDLAHQLPGRRAYRPMIYVSADDASELPLGTVLAWWDRPALVAEVVAVSADGQNITLMVTAGHGRGRPQAAALPVPGSEAVFGPWTAERWRGSAFPGETPWTHRPPAQVDVETLSS